MELYNEIYGPPIFDVYNDEEPIFDVPNDAGDNLAVLRFDYFASNIQVIDSRITLYIHSSDRVINDSSFGSSRRNNVSFKEIIDRSYVEALSSQLWIRSITHKINWHASSAPTRPIKSHEPLTSSPKKLGEEEQVPRKPPPLRDKKFAQIIWLGEETEQVQTSFQWFASNLEDKVLYLEDGSIDEILLKKDDVAKSFSYF